MSIFQGCFDGAEGLSRGEMLHKNIAVVKITGVEKVGKVSMGVAYDFVNRGIRGWNGRDCGKLLWRNLWRLWKSIGFQQVFRGFEREGAGVEKCAFRFA